MDELETRKNTYQRDKTRYEAWVRHRAEYNLIALKLLWAEFYEARDNCNRAMALKEAKAAEYDQAAARLPQMEAEMKAAEQLLESNSKEIKASKEAVKGEHVFPLPALQSLHPFPILIIHPSPYLRPQSQRRKLKMP